MCCPLVTHLWAMIIGLDASCQEVIMRFEVVSKWQNSFICFEMPSVLSLMTNGMVDHQFDKRCTCPVAKSKQHHVADGLDRSPLRVGECTGAINASASKHHPRPSPVPAPAPAPTPTPAPVPIPNPATGLQGVPGPPNLKTILGEAANHRQSQDELQQAKEELTRLKSMLPDVSLLRPEGGSIHTLDTMQLNPNHQPLIHKPVWTNYNCTQEQFRVACPLWESGIFW